MKTYTCPKHGSIGKQNAYIARKHTKCCICHRKVKFEESSR
ncbi:hypothetical protein [Anaeroselena agilis]|uniref:Uncharacterized protein n=1 Tax=Anaeroselena agilis TaxID=3063788 RepID=A0ABU3NYJ5_9FIRM|nr:hypothetical protein [Selenomonadales bacterium 4137-cl]